MFGSRRIWSALVALGLIIAVAVPAMAQSNPGPGSPQQPAPGAPQQPAPGAPLQPNPGERVSERCLQAGLGLVVLSQDGTVADILGNSDPQATSAIAATRAMTVYIDAPANVGMCADFQAYWGGGVKGLAAGRLRLFAAPLDPSAAPVARDGAEETRTGPSAANKRLRAVTKIDKPGTYAFVAAYEVEAKPDAGDGKTDGVRLPLTVVYREKPKPGAIAGVVTGPDGKPMAGALVSASPFKAPQAGVPGNPPFVGMPIERPVVMGDGSADQTAPQQGGKGGVITDAQGKYRLVINPGTYAVAAEARGFKVQWYNLKADRKSADPVEVKAEQDTNGIDFKLAAADPKPPEPSKDTGTITGTVTDGLGAPLKGIAVMANPPVVSLVPGNPPFAADAPDQQNPSPIGATRGNAAKTNEQGVYELKVPVGKWIVVASGAGFVAQWFDGQTDPKLAKVLDVAKDAKIANVNFKLAAAPKPVEPDKGTISGVVTDAGGAPLKGAVVMATAPMTTVNPGRPPFAAVLPDQQMPGFSTGFTARTDERGAYSLKVPVGKWIARASQDGKFLPQWFDGQAEAKNAKVLDVAKDATVGDVNFHLAKLPVATVSGKLTRADGTAIKGGSVQAAKRGPDGKPIEFTVPAGYQLSARLAEDGSYSLLLPPGEFAIGATVATASNRGGVKLWWNQKATLAEADLLTLADGDARTDINFQFQ